MVSTANSQVLSAAKQLFTHDDTLRGSITAYRNWWDVKYYKLAVEPNFVTQSLKGTVTLLFTVTEATYKPVLQIDLQDSLPITSAVFNGKPVIKYMQRFKNYALFTLPQRFFKNGMQQLAIGYAGTPKKAKNAPWDGGLVWRKDSLGNPWLATACQGLGASVWFPCKDHQSDEPDNGAEVTITVPNNLKAISNGELTAAIKKGDSATAYTWQVNSPINSYNITMNVGNYTTINSQYNGEKGVLPLTYHVLSYNKQRALQQFEQVPTMLRCFEYWFGPYPFYADGYQLVETPFLGMEHQSAVAYGNKYKNGYLGNDLSGTGKGLLWDFIIIHESGHEWFGNNITTKDIADMWVHESFTNYSEVLFTQCQQGKDAANQYAYGLRRSIANDVPIIGAYGVNHEGSGDMYMKGANMLHTLRNSINNDEKFRGLLRALNATFYHQTVTGKQVEMYISNYLEKDLEPFFQQYLYTTQIPVLELMIDSAKLQLHHRFTNCVEGFTTRVVSTIGDKQFAFTPSNEWTITPITLEDVPFIQPKVLEKQVYLRVNQYPWNENLLKPSAPPMRLE
ncbi:MAG: M1 family peptidase [Bacteroidetes bacterium]|nr:MAG: M1 family peptidase [Bacteroidota bacterium]TAE69679.1 MAG: M1 family peptidase [Bacteroidota bacterium]TAF93029.1 MAG: M1 family peptidase [Bacteroidota bacterium]